MKLGIKLSIAIFLIALFISAISGALLNQYFSDILVRQLNKDDAVKLSAATEALDGIFVEADKYGRQIAINPTVQKYLQADTFPLVFYQFSMRNQIREFFTSLIFLAEHMQSIALVKSPGDIVWTDMPYNDATTGQYSKAWYETLAQHWRGNPDAGITVSEPYWYDGMSQRGAYAMQLVSISLPIRSMDAPSNRLGFVILNINWQHVTELVRRSAADFDVLAYVQGTERIFVASDVNITQDMVAHAMEAKEDGRPNAALTVHTQSALLGGQIIAAQNHPRLLRSIRPQIMTMMAILVAAMALIVLILIPVLLRMTSPAKVLAGAMKQVGEGDLQTRVKIRTQDEFADLGDGFNAMVERLEGYLQESLQHETDKHRLEYEVLVAQINPHFIYNTLNTIIHLARKESPQDIIVLTRALIDLLQDGIRLSGNKIYSTVEEEIWIIENYLVIQNYRYKDLFTLSIHCEEALKKELVPSSVIQPIVENALFHGIAPLNRQGHITVTIQRQAESGQDMLQLTIEDDGVGISPEQAQRILSGEVSPHDSARNHVGIHNVVERLALLYGTNFTFFMGAKEQGGTSVVIRFPTHRDGEEKIVESQTK